MAITAIAANGWQATYSGTPGATRLDEALTITQPGYDATGAAATDTRTILVTNRIRVPATTGYTANTVGLSQKVIAGATASGVTVGSTQVSPLPICAWTGEFRQLIGSGARTVSATGAHYAFKLDGRPLACMIFSASDGTTTVYQTATTLGLGAESTDAQPVYEYKATFTGAQMASLAEGLITYNCRAIPWVGDNTQSTDLLRSIANTADWSARGQSEAAGWSPRYDVKDLTRFATQPRCYVDPVSGSNSTGIWGTAAQDGAGGATDPSLFPFLNAAGALTLTAAKGPAAGSSSYLNGTLIFDGCRIRLRAATHAIGTAAAGFKTVKCAALIVEPAPGVSRSAAVIDFGLSGRFRLGNFSGVPGCALTFSGISTTRSTSSAVTFESGQVCTFTLDNCAVDNNSVTGTFVTAGGIVSVRYHATSLVNVAGSFMTGANYFRGGTIAGTGISVSCLTLLGARIPDCQTLTINNDTVHFGVFLTALSTLASPVVVVGGASLSNVFRAGCIYEMAQATQVAMERISGDGDTVNTFNHIKMHCTTVGYSANGRRNNYYVDASSPTTSRDRTHQFIREENNIECQDNSKHDLFPTVDALRIGGWERLYGVGHNSNFTMYLNAGNSSTPGGGSFGPEYDGPNSNLGTSITVMNDPKFVAPAHVTSGGAGAGGGNYALQSSSPALTMSAGPALPGFGAAVGAVAPSSASAPAATWSQALTGTFVAATGDGTAAAPSWSQSLSFARSSAIGDGRAPNFTQSQALGWTVLPASGVGASIAPAANWSMAIALSRAPATGGASAPGATLANTIGLVMSAATGDGGTAGINWHSAMTWATGSAVGTGGGGSETVLPPANRTIIFRGV